MNKIMIMAAGTGGHVFPGIALAEELTKKNIEICWLGTPTGMEKEWVENAKIPFHSINIQGLRGKGALGWLLSPLNVFKAILQARKIMKQQQPDLVLGMGGFVCGPGGIAAKLLGIKLALHEQNAIPGLTNKLLSYLAELVITAFPQQTIKGEHVKQLGNPVRDGLEQIPVLQAGKDEINLLVIGGSRGALALNQVLPKVLKILASEMPINILHQTGSKTLADTKKFYQQVEPNLSTVNYKVVAFIDNMVEAYAKADLVICRSGALTVSELMASARPAIMIPYPYAVDDHQTANAQVLVDLGGGEIIQQTYLNPETLTISIKNWLEKDKNQQASADIRNQVVKESTKNITKALMFFFVMFFTWYMFCLGFCT